MQRKSLSVAASLALVILSGQAQANAEGERAKLARLAHEIGALEPVGRTCRALSPRD